MAFGRAVVVGAGVAGLRCASVLVAAGVETVVVEAKDRPGGRMATEVVDGFTIDAGFQLLNPSYPQAAHLDLAGLELGSFTPGMIISDGSTKATLTDPLRRPVAALGSLGPGPGTLQGRVRLGLLLARLRFGDPARVLATPDQPARSWFRAEGVDEATIDQVLRPFLAGVLLDDQLEDSAHLVALLLRSFARGIPGVPKDGMGAIPQQMAADLPEGSLRLSTPVAAVTKRSVTLGDGTTEEADLVIVATAGLQAQGLVGGTPALPARSVTTWWFATEEPLPTGSTLVVDASGEVLVNLVEMTAAQPRYAPAGRFLVACSALGLHADSQAEVAVRRRAAVLAGTSTDRWELVAVTPIAGALPAVGLPLDLAPPNEINGVLLAGDHLATPSIQGAMASGERAAKAGVLRLRRGKSGSPRR